MEDQGARVKHEISKMVLKKLCVCVCVIYATFDNMYERLNDTDFLLSAKQTCKS